MPKNSVFATVAASALALALATDSSLTVALREPAILRSLLSAHIRPRLLTRVSAPKAAQVSDQDRQFGSG